MGCSIHSFAEKLNTETNTWEVVKNHFTLDGLGKKIYNKEKTDHPFYWRHYEMFEFLANVRGSGICEPLSDARGFPPDASVEVLKNYILCEPNYHSVSYLTSKELTEFNYDKPILASKESDSDEKISYKELLGSEFMIHLKELKSIGKPEEVRIVFWFDN